MDHRTDGADRAPQNLDRCTKRDWCELAAGHGDEHAAEPEYPNITATAYAEDLVPLDDGVAVPQVWTRLLENELSNAFDRYSIQIAVMHPSSHSHSTECFLTLREARLLAKALSELLDVAP